MLGFKSYRTAAVTLAGIELAHRIRKRQFKFGPGRWICTQRPVQSRRVRRNPLMHQILIVTNARLSRTLHAIGCVPGQEYAMDRMVWGWVLSREIRWVQSEEIVHAFAILTRHSALRATITCVVASGRPFT